MECGRYGAYIIDKTDEVGMESGQPYSVSRYQQDICSLECKARRLKHLGIIIDGPGHMTGGSGRGFGESGWSYTLHPEVASWSEVYVQKLRKEVSSVECNFFQFSRYIHLAVGVSEWNQSATPSFIVGPHSIS